ncbi:MAG: hypothetical protein IIZ28_05780 [Erysipelotrichaceae bacterium]|nr:hypothetical protein [Erysipelotrichaceae bacterium]
MKKLLIICICLLFFFSCKTVKASPLVTVEADGTVDGFVGEDIGSKIVVLKLTDPDYYFEVEKNDDISNWFPDIPEGLTAKVAAYVSDNIHVSFEGVPLQEKDEFIFVAVPDGSVIDSNSGDGIGVLENTPSENAEFKIAVKEPQAVYERQALITGTAGEAIEPQKVYVQLTDTTCEASMIGHVFPEHNGLTPVCIDVLSSNVLIIEYTGIPENEDRSLIHTLLLNEDLKCDLDLEVPDREDVRFDIGVKEAPAEPDPEPEPEPVVPEPVIEEPVTEEEAPLPDPGPAIHIIPVTGIE